MELRSARITLQRLHDSLNVPLKYRSPRTRWSSWIFGVLVLLAVVVIAARFGEGHRIWRLLRETSLVSLGVAAFLQTGTYVLFAMAVRAVLRHEQQRCGFRGLISLALARQFVSQVVPSAGMSGHLLILRGLQNRSIPRPQALHAVGANLIAYNLAFASVIVVAIVILWAHADLSRLTLGLLSAVLVLLTLIAGAVVWIGKANHRGIPIRLHRTLRKLGVHDILSLRRTASPSGVLLFEVTCLHFGIFVLDSATLYELLRSANAAIDPAIALSSVVVASAIASIGFVPAGLGTFEGTCVALLHAHGIGLDQALAGTLLLRAFTFWLPMIPGVWMTRREMRISP